MSKTKSSSERPAGKDVCVGPELEKLIQRLGMSQEAFAEQIGVNRTSVSHWINLRRSPNGSARKLIEELAKKSRK
jgi:DNA-binding transcriptional regulator YiaG